MINDRFGHAEGDRAIQAFVEVVQREIRETDLLARFGGEEFVILMPETDLSQAVKAADRICVAYRQYRLETINEAQRIEMAVSIGAAVLQEGDQTPEQLITRADEAMYIAKNTGRNRVASIPEES